MRTILLICFSLLGTLPTVYGQSSIEKDRDAFRREADRFLSAMPDGLQEQQTQAILQAIQGDTVPLTRIRASRNIPTPLPTDVNAIYITPALRLYTPVKRIKVLCLSSFTCMEEDGHSEALTVAPGFARH